MVSNILIKEASFDESEIISSVLLHAFEEFRAHYTKEAFEATVITPYEVTRRMKEGKVWVAELANTVVGTISIIKKQDSYHIRGMAVLPTSRGLRIGYRLLEKVESMARYKKVKQLHLCTTPYLTSAIQLYKSFGFFITNEGPYQFHEMPLFHMRKNITFSA